MIEDPDTTPSFRGFPAAGLTFLRDLSAAQDRDWFKAHKPAYEAHVVGPTMALVADLSAALSKRGIPLRGDPKRSVFRIHRDVRFSKDKRPLKTHVGVALTRDGEKTSPGVLYVHIDPAGSFAACGFFQPEPRALGALRDAMVARAGAFRRAVAELTEAGLVPSPDADALKRPPRGFEAVSEPDLLEALRRRSHIVRRPFPDDALAAPGFVEAVADFADAAAPLLRFGWSALDDR